MSETKVDTKWVKGWTPWGTPCGVQLVDGAVYKASATEANNCPVARLATARINTGGTSNVLADRRHDS